MHKIEFGLTLTIEFGNTNYDAKTDHRSTWLVCEMRVEFDKKKLTSRVQEYQAPQPTDPEDFEIFIWEWCRPFSTKKTAI